MRSCKEILGIVPYDGVVSRDACESVRALCVAAAIGHGSTGAWARARRWPGGTAAFHAGFGSSDVIHFGHERVFGLSSVDIASSSLGIAG